MTILVINTITFIKLLETFIFYSCAKNGVLSTDEIKLLLSIVQKVNIGDGGFVVCGNEQNLLPPYFFSDNATGVGGGGKDRLPFKTERMIVWYFKRIL